MNRNNKQRRRRRPPFWRVRRRAPITWLLTLPLIVLLTLGAASIPPPQTGSLAVAQASPWMPLAPAAFVPLILHGHSDEGSLFGIQLYATEISLAEKADQAGVAWIRIPLTWDSIEPINMVPAQYRWPQSLDNLLADLSARNVKTIFTLSRNPSWAATYPGGPVDLVDKSELVQFMEAAVRRYGAPPYNVKHWELYNEPDNGSTWHAQKPGYGYFGYQPAAYVDLLRSLYGPIKAIDPDAQIVLGGIAYDNWNDGSNGLPFVRDFLDNVLEQGGGAYFDMMNFHYYPVVFTHWDAYGHGIIGKATFLRSKLAEYGVFKPIICTESGMWSDAVHGGSDELQSRYIPKLFARSAAAGLKLTIWFHLIDETSLGGWKYGLLNPDQSPKPSFSAYHTATEQLANAQYRRALGPDETGSDQLEAYEYSKPGSAMRIIVAWTNDEMSHPLVLAADQVVLVAKYGGKTTIYDISDGIPDGHVELSIGPSPVYLHLQP